MGEIDTAIAKAKAETLDRVMKEICPLCAAGWPVNDAGLHTSREGCGACKAEVVRKMREGG